MTYDPFSFSLDYVPTTYVAIHFYLADSPTPTTKISRQMRIFPDINIFCLNGKWSCQCRCHFKRELIILGWFQYIQIRIHVFVLTFFIGIACKTFHASGLAKIPPTRTVIRTMIKPMPLAWVSSLVPNSFLSSAIRTENGSVAEEVVVYVTTSPQNIPLPKIGSYSGVISHWFPLKKALFNLCLWRIRSGGGGGQVVQPLQWHQQSKKCWENCVSHFMCISWLKESVQTLDTFLRDNGKVKNARTTTA